MRQRQIRTLRTVLFFLLAVIFAVLAVIEAIPVKEDRTYSIATPFKVTSAIDEDGQYLNTITGSVQNNSSSRKNLSGVVLLLAGRDGETYETELSAGRIDAGKALIITGTVKTAQPVSRVLSVSTPAVDGDQPITSPQSGLSITTGFFVFAALSCACLAVAVMFFISRLRYRSQHHHKSESASKS